MAHNLETNVDVNGFERVSYIENGKNEVAWHQLGTVYDRPLKAIEALQGCYADYEVGLQPIAAITPQILMEIEKGGFINAAMLKDLIIEGKKATMRFDKNETLGIVSDKYGVVQNKNAFDFIDVLTTGQLGGEIPTIESAGVLGKGERIFITAKFPEPIIIENNKNDIVNMYIVFTTSHDGTGAVTCMVTPIRVVCNNTLNMAFRENSGRISMRHTSNIVNRLNLMNEENAKMAYNSLKLYDVYKKSFESSIKELSQIKVTDKDVEKILSLSLLSPDNLKIYNKNGFVLNSSDITTNGKNLIEKAKNAIYTGVGQEISEKGTGLWLVNGITSFYQNHQDSKDIEYKFDSISNGVIQRNVQKVFELVNAVA